MDVSSRFFFLSLFNFLFSRSRLFVHKRFVYELVEFFILIPVYRNLSATIDWKEEYNIRLNERERKNNNEE